MGIIAMDINKPCYMSIFLTTSPGLQRRASTELLSDAAALFPNTFLMALENYVSSWPSHLTYSPGMSSGFTLHIHSSMFSSLSLLILSLPPARETQAIPLQSSLFITFLRLLRASLAVSLPHPGWSLPGC